MNGKAELFLYITFPKTNSRYMNSFLVDWRHLTRAELSNHLSKLQLSMGR